LTPLQIINNGNLNNLATLLPQWSFWLPSTEWYVGTDSLSENVTNYRTELARLMGQLPPNQTINQDSQSLNQLVERQTTAIYPAIDSKVAYIAFFFTLGHTRNTDRLVTNHDRTLLTWDTVECYAGVCQQSITHIHGIVILQGPRTTPWYEHALRTLHPRAFINVSPLQKDSKAAYFYIKKQLINPLRVVHYLANHVKKRIPGYIPYYGENTVSDGDEILSGARQGDCPSVIACKWTNTNENVYNRAATLFRLLVAQIPYVTSRCLRYTILNTPQSKDAMLVHLVAYFGEGAIFDPADWKDPNARGQTMLLSLGFWHGQPAILLDVNDYPGTSNIGQQLLGMTCPALSYCQLVVVTGDPAAITNITHTRQLCGIMETNGATLASNLNQI
jgi:hypothetical protein